MLKKLKDFWANPYAAPLTKPLKNIAMTVLTATGSYVYAVKDAFNDKYRTQRELERSRISRIYRNIFDSSFVEINIINGIGSALAGLGAGIAAGAGTWSGLAGAGVVAQVAATGAAGIAAATVAVLAAPVVLATTIAAAAVVVGVVVGVVPGVIGGTAQALKHHKQLKNSPPAPAQPAAVPPSAKAIEDEKVLRICKDFSTLPAQTQQALIDRLERSASSPQTPQQKMMKDIDRMTGEQRVTLAEMLEEKLANEFDIVASKRAAEAGALDEDIAIKPISTNLRRRNASPAGGTTA